MEIIDGQVHLNQLGLEACLAAMDAVGIDAAIIDEYPTTSVALPNGARRYAYPQAEAAARAFPARFAYVARIDPADPEMAALMAGVRAQPGCLGIRVDQPSRASFGEGRYTAYFAAAERAGNPVWIVLPGRMDEIAPYARAFPGLQFVIDHAGMPETWNRTAPDRFRPLDDVLALAALPNVAVKWGHFTKFSDQPFPYPDALGHLRRVVDAFGAERVIWESDWTQCLGHETLAEMLFVIRLSDRFTAAEKDWILGRAALKAMRWQRPDDRVDAIVIGAADRAAFRAAAAARGQLFNGRVRIIELSGDDAPALRPGTRCISTVALPGATFVDATEAARTAVTGRFAQAK